MNKFSLISLFIFLEISVFAQTGNRRVHNSQNPYRDSYQRVSCGQFFTLEIRNGALWAYGYNGYGQLGDGTTTDPSAPEQIGTATNWMMVSAGGNHSLGIQSDGTLWAWGQNVYGQLGDGTNNNSHIPEQIGTDTTWISVSAGTYHSLALKADGTLWAWGVNDNGQLGDGTNNNKNTPEQIGGNNNWTMISANDDYSFAIRSDGTLWAWGLNDNSYLGDGTNITRLTPFQIGTGNNWTNISAGQDHTLALQANGTLWTWGNNSYGQLGDGTQVNESKPIQVGTSNNWVTSAAGNGHSLAIKADGSLWVWGYNFFGQLGDGTSTNAFTPEQIALQNKWVAVNAGSNYSFALSANGQLNAFGNNGFGNLGDGTIINQNLPEKISAVVNWVKIAPGANHTLALRSDGTLWGWGNNNQGDIGDSTGVTRFSPVEVYGNATWVNCEAGIDFSLGIKQDGTLWAWGDNYYGQVGDGTSGGTNSRYAPVEISAANDWVGLSAGGEFSMALKANGTIWTWGNTDGLGRSGSATTPQQVGTDSNWVRMDAGGGPNGGDQALVIKSNGTLWSWGSNSVGQLGLGGSPGGSVPTQVGTESDWVCVSGGQGFSEGIKADGSLWGWGGNSYGEVGNGGSTSNNYNAPVRVDSGINNWINVTTGTLHAVGLRSDGSLWAWGYDFSGELGAGSNGNSSVPIKTIPPNGWGAIGAGTEANSSIALEPDRITYCATGAGYTGMLGDGNSASRNTYGCTTLVMNTLPVAAFTANPLTVCMGNTVTFTDQSTGSPTAWKWTFTGGTPDTSSSKKPVVRYNSTGFYNVQLVVTNSGGSDTIKKTNYINVTSAPVVNVSPVDTSVCAGNPVTLTATGATSYTWLPASGLNATTGSAVSAATDSSITYKVIGSSNGCADTASVAIAIAPLPVAGTILSPKDSICAGTPVSLSLTGSSGNIQWQSSQDGISFNNITGDTLTLYNADGVTQTTYYEALASNSCGTDTSSVFKLVVNPLPVPVVTTNDSLICSDDSTEIQTTKSYSDYLWSDADTRPYTYVSAAGGYWVTVTDANGCSGISNHVNIGVYPVPSVSIVVRGDTLSSFNSVSYQWYRDGEALPGANSPTYIAGDSGYYTVQIVDTNGCKAVSTPVYAVTTGIIIVNAGNKLSIYPNPADEFIAVKLNLKEAEGVLSLYNSIGQLLWTSSLKSEQTVRVKELPAGMYCIGLESGTGYSTSKIIIQH